jgi:hypothetical protein
MFFKVPVENKRWTKLSTFKELLSSDSDSVDIEIVSDTKAFICVTT